MPNQLRDQLLRIVSTRVAATAWAWLAGARQSAGRAPLDALLTAYATAAVRFGRAPLDLTAREQHAIASVVSGLRCDRWTLDDAARALLLMARREGGRVGATFVADALACYEQGDAREQQSWLRAIAIWPEAAEFLSTAIDACRTNIIPVFESVACENPYPARQFPDPNFNQMVLKALFNAIAVSRIAGLEQRRNPDLARMARDYEAERGAAGRTVPSDIALVTGAHSNREQRS